jgi:hypothetical protein
VKILSILLLVFLYTSCSKKQEHSSQTNISKDTMVMVLSELHVSQAGIGIRGLDADSAERLYNLEKYQILKRYGLTDNRFKANYNAYLQQVEEMEHIYARVVDSLGLQETKLNAMQK